MSLRALVPQNLDDLTHSMSFAQQGEVRCSVGSRRLGVRPLFTLHAQLAGESLLDDIEDNDGKEALEHWSNQVTTRI